MLHIVPQLLFDASLFSCSSTNRFLCKSGVVRSEVNHSFIPSVLLFPFSAAVWDRANFWLGEIMSAPLKGILSMPWSDCDFSPTSCADGGTGESQLMTVGGSCCSVGVGTESGTEKGEHPRGTIYGWIWNSIWVRVLSFLSIKDGGPRDKWISPFHDSLRYIV